MIGFDKEKLIDTWKHMGHVGICLVSFVSNLQYIIAIGMF